MEVVEHSEERCGEHHPVYTADEDTSNQQSDGNTHQTCQAYSSSLTGSTDRRGHAASAKTKLCLVRSLCKTLSRSILQRCRQMVIASPVALPLSAFVCQWTGRKALSARSSEACNFSNANAGGNHSIDHPLFLVALVQTIILCAIKP